MHSEMFMSTQTPHPCFRITRRKNCPGEKPGAVVIGGDYQGLGIVRSLGSAGVPICVIDDEHSIARYSRYTTYAARVPSLRDANHTVEALLELGRFLDLRGWVLFPTRDEIVAALSMHRASLSDIYRVPSPDWSAIQFIWDKRKTYSLARKLGIPIPRTWFAGQDGSIDQINGPFPLALKPAIKEHFFYATKAKAWRANNRTELTDMYRRAAEFANQDEILVQDLIPGGGSQQFAYCAFFKDGKALGRMVACRRRQHPHEFGRASTYVETIDLPELERLSERFLQHINYYGLVEMEYKLDPRDGQYKLLDVNARTWGYHTLGPCAGVDFPRILYSDQLGLDVQSRRGKPGVCWVRLLTDLPTGIADVVSGRLGLGDYIKSLRAADTEAVFSRRDPMPGLVECAFVPYLAVRRGF